MTILIIPTTFRQRNSLYNTRIQAIVVSTIKRTYVRASLWECVCVCVYKRSSARDFVVHQWRPRDVMESALNIHIIKKKTLLFMYIYEYII